MDVVLPSIEPSFGEVHFGSACLGDKRRTRRLVKTADKIMAHPGGSLPLKMNGWADLMGLYRLVSAKAVTHQAVIQSHCRRTLQLAAQSREVVLIIQDTEELDYTHVPALADQLGPVGNGGGRGYLCHNVLAVTADRQVIGLAAQLLHRRRRVPAGETPARKRRHPDRESLLWLRACRKMDQLGQPPRSSRQSLWVHLADRGADTFEFLEALGESDRKYLVRCARDRKLAGEDHLGTDRIHQYLLNYTRDLPRLGERTLEVARQQKNRRHPARAARTARLAVAAGPARIARPHFARGHGKLPWLDLWVVHVREIDPPDGTQGLEWVLLTNVSTQTWEQACQRIDWYSCRVMVEELHKGTKTGCQIESMQFEDVSRLEPMIGLLSVVATALLQLRQVARRKDADTTPAASLAPALFVAVLSGWRYKQVRPDMSLWEFHMALARLGGHLNRKSDGFPGWLTLWRGWENLQMMVLGAQAIREPKCV